MKMKHGAQKELAKATGKSPTELNDILHGRRRMTGDTAMKLEDVSEKVLGKKVSAREWIKQYGKKGGVV